MFSSRITQKNRTHRLRSTFKQRGGAPWATLDPARLADWTMILNGAPDLQFIITPAAVPIDQRVPKYISIIERQDELFGFAMKAIYAKLNVNERSSEQAIIDGLNTYTATPGNSVANLTGFLDDIGKLIYFNPYAPPPRSTLKTKMQEIKARPNYFIELLVNPEQVQNRFVKDLAAICVEQKRNPAILAAAVNLANRYVRALRYEAVSEANAAIMTSNKLRDGFFPSQPWVTFRGIMGHDRGDVVTGFWYKFLIRCGPAGNIYSEDDNERFAYYAAAIFTEYNKPALPIATLKTRVLTMIVTPLRVLRRAPARAAAVVAASLTPIANRPDIDQSGDNVGLVADGLNMDELLRYIKIGDLQFIVHLIHTITVADAVPPSPSPP